MQCYGNWNSCCKTEHKSLSFLERVFSYSLILFLSLSLTLSVRHPYNHTLIFANCNFQITISSHQKDSEFWIRLNTISHTYKPTPFKHLVIMYYLWWFFAYLCKHIYVSQLSCSFGRYFVLVRRWTGRGGGREREWQKDRWSRRVRCRVLKNLCISTLSAIPLSTISCF